MMIKKIILLLLLISAVVLGWSLFQFFVDYNTLNEMEENFDKIDPSKDLNFLAYESPKKPKISASIVVPYTYEGPPAKYSVTKNGIKISSADDRWTTSELDKVYEELLKNKHGDEIEYLDSIMLLPESKWPEELGTDTDGFYVQGAESIPLALTLNNYILPKDIFHVFYEKSSISLLVEDKSEVKELLRTLSHEYGHHYTMFYMEGEDGSFSEFKEVRGVSDHPRIKEYFGDDYKQNHKWDVMEVAAEDYVQLMGYYEKEVLHYIDVEQALDRYVRTGKDTNERYFNSYTINVNPQENFYLPLASEVKGLDEYFHSFLDMEGDSGYFKPEMEIKLSHKRISNNNWQVSWTPIQSDDSDILYTLVMYKKEEKDQIIDPVKTVKGSGDLKAFIGKATYTTSTMIYSWNDNRVKRGEPGYFKVYALYPSGYIASSELYQIDF